MAAPAILAQTVLSALSGTGAQDQCSKFSNGTDSSSISNALIQPSFTNIPAFIASLLSISALRDWLKLFVIGGFFESCRRLAVRGYHTVYNWFFITAVFMEEDESFDWIMVWMLKHTSWNNARDVQVSTRSFGLPTNAVLVPGEEEDDPSATANGDRPLSYIPSYSSTHTFWYKRHWCQVSRLQKDGSEWYRTKEDYLELCIFAWDKKVLNQLLLEAKKAYKTAQDNAISIYASDPNHGWRHITTRPKRPLSSIVLDPGIKDVLFEDAQDFLDNKSWYSVRGIPFRRGYLLYGAPGSGKTSIIHSLAGELGLDIYIVSLSRAGMDDSSLNECISELPEKCIALMEDIDAAFTTPLNRDIPDDSTKSSDTPPQAQQQQERVSKVTLSGLLNALDGVAAQEGRLLFATTNKYESLDPALIRPGRMDLHIEFKLASQYQARELYRCFFLPDSELIAEAEARSKSQGSDVDEKKVETTEKSLIDLDEASSNTSETSTAVPSTLPSPSHKLISLPDAVTPTVLSPESEIRSHRRSKTPKLPTAEVNRLAAAFSEVLPEREFSMASLQGYLMTYKTRPAEAVTNFPAWIEKERREKREAKEKEKQKQEKEKVEKEKKEKEEKEKKEKEKKENEEKEKKEKEEKERKEKEEQDIVKRVIKQLSEGSKDGSNVTTAPMTEAKSAGSTCLNCSQSS